MRNPKTFCMHRVRRLAGACLVATMIPFASGFAAESEVVARVNGKDITAAELRVAEQMYAQQLGDMPEDAKRSVLVNALIEMRLIADAARADNVTEQEGYKLQMAFFGDQTLRALFLEAKIAAAVTDSTVKAAFDEQVAQMPPVLEMQVRHILLRSESDARDVIEQLKSGRPFADLAKERSADEASKPLGGDLGYIAEGQTLPEIEQAARQLQPGMFTQTPVPSAFGFHVVLLEATRNRPAPPFETVAAQIRRSLEEAEQQRIVGQLRAAAQVEKLVPDVAPPASEDGHEH